MLLDRFQFALNRMKKAIHRADARKLELLFKQASDVRRGMQ